MLDTGGAKFLVDCGLRQGQNEDEDSNWKEFAYNPAEVSHLVITHAHIDHIGRIPKLVKAGFRGTILSTHATRALVEPLLLDAMDILAHHAEREGREHLYNEGDIAATLKLWKPVGYHERVTLPDDVTLELLDAGHILGSAMIKFTRGGKTLVVTGDLGGGNSPLLAPTEDLTGVDYLVMESVYGDKTRPLDTDRRDLLENVIEDAMARGGTLLIPAFSTERTQDLLYEIRTLMTEKRIPEVPVYVDSPLADKITHAFLECPDYFSPEMQKRIKAGENIFTFPQMQFVEDAKASQKLHEGHGPRIILAGSGMGSGGRIVGHQTYVLPDPNSTLCIVGYQAAGTTGRRLLEGAKTVTLYKQQVAVKCKVEAVYGYSAHMDGEALLEFANKTASSLKEVFVVEGEPASAAFLAQRIRDYLGVKATTPEAGQSAVIPL
jgi:metallo-beta-lactamase family protein